MTIEEDDTIEEIEEAIGHLSGSTKRCLRAVGRGDTVTDWDKLHTMIDAQLDARDQKLVVA